MKKVLLAFLVILFGLLIYFPFLPNEKMTEENVNRPQRVLDQAEQELIKREAQKRKALKTEGRTAPALQSVQEEGPNLPEPICRGGYCFAGMAKEMVFDRTDTNTIVLATETGGAWFSSTRGESWQVIDDDWASIYLLTVMQSQTDPNLFFFGGFGLWTWDKSKVDEGLKEYRGMIDGVADTSFSYVHKIKPHPNDPNRFYVATNTAIYEFSNDEFKLLADDQVITELGDFEILPDNSLISIYQNYIVTKQGDSTYRFKTEYDITWIGGEVTYKKSDSNLIFAYVLNRPTNDLYLYRSKDAGKNWELSNHLIRSQQFHDQMLEFYEYDDSTDMITLGTVSSLVAFVDNQHSEFPVFNRYDAGHADHHQTHFIDRQLYSLTDGGIFKTDLSSFVYDPDIVFQFPKSASLSNGFNSIQAVDIALHPSNETWAAGLWHNGSWQRKLDGSFLYLNGGDGFESTYHPSNDDLVYSSLQNGLLFRTSISNESTSIIRAGGGAFFETNVFTHHTMPNALFYPGNGIFVLEDATECMWPECNWVKAFEGNDRLKEVFTDNQYGHNELYYYEYEQRKLFRIDDLSNMAPVDTELPIEEFIYHIQFDHDLNQNRLFVMTSDIYGDFFINVFSNANNAEETVLLDRIPLHIPSGFLVEKFLISPFDENLILLTTSLGLYYKESWDAAPLPFLQIPAVEVTDIEYKGSTNKIFLSTYGRGIWSMEFNPTVSNVDVQTETSFQVYPNPTSDYLIIQNEKKSSYQIYNVSGQLLRSFDAVNERYQVDISDLVPGVYLIKSSGQSRGKRFVKI